MIKNDEFIDGYALFFKEFINETDSNVIFSRLWKFAEQSMKCVDEKNVEKSWKSLCDSIENKDSNVFVRKYGRESQNNQRLLKEFYKFLFGESFEVNIDKNNNDKPKKMLSEYTDYSVTKSEEKKILKNFQTSHVFAKTKNCFAFTAPWNVVYLPKILDPFTGHEAKGEIKIKFERTLQKYFCKKYEVQIREFNSKMEIYKNDLNSKREDLQKKLLAVDDNEAKVNRFIKEMEKQFAPIEIDGILEKEND
ncbi:uncharacterized protein SALIVB_0048 [Streptococcus salivarius CCHSS3]|uniref:hypothetical protein n=1 Tax=Streptococcus salivarius TaxID=1304 RepID=UPI0002145F79|nr:hypothetical protein [Streptococcus salivarius]CCB92394.1 uncharacterized protein SALIVB_0048 [Streptococcus salivarius CCHSS3]